MDRPHVSRTLPPERPMLSSHLVLGQALNWVPLASRQCWPSGATGCRSASAVPQKSHGQDARATHRRRRLLFLSLVLVLILPGRAGAQSVAARRPAAPNFETIRDVVYQEHDGEPLRADIYEPRSGGLHAAVLLVHGGAWTSGNRTQLDGIAKFLATFGYTVVAIDYRLAPKYKFPAQIEDCRDALAWMRDHAAEYKIDPTRLAAWGYSAGGHLVALLGTTTPGLAAVVAGGAPCDFRPLPPDNPYVAFWLDGTRRTNPKAYENASPARFVSADCPPVFFYHGEYDRLVPLAQPRAMAAELNRLGVPAELHAIKNTGHLGGMIDRDAAMQGKRFLDRYLRDGKPR